MQIANIKQFTREYKSRIITQNLFRYTLINTTGQSSPQSYDREAEKEGQFAARGGMPCPKLVRCLPLRRTSNNGGTENFRLNHSLPVNIELVK